MQTQPTQKGAIKTAKFKNKKVRHDGKVFDSILEFNRYCELKKLAQLGLITDLETQVKYVLIPAQRELPTVGSRGGVKRGKVIERECAYYADFVYKDKDGKTVVEDTKGVYTAEYKIKRKLMLYVHGIRIVEITDTKKFNTRRKKK